MKRARRSGAKKYKYYACKADIGLSCMQVFTCKHLLKRTLPNWREYGIVELDLRHARDLK